MARIKENLYFLAGGGEMGELTRNKNWADTPMGSPEGWPQSLRTTLSILLNSKFPMFLFWGTDLICFYNDAYRPSLGAEGKHPAILGAKAQEFWKEIWDDIKPLIDIVMNEGGATWSENQLLPIYRNGRMEDVYWTFSYSPVRDEIGGVAGVMVVCSETTMAVKAIAKLKESEERFRTMAESSSLLIALADNTSKAVYFNKAWTKFTGRSSRELKDFGWADLIHEDERQYVLQTYMAIFEKQEPWQVECRMLDKNNDYRWILAYMTPRFNADGTFEGYINSTIDIHDRKIFEQEAFRFKYLADNADDSFLWMRRDGSFEYLNDVSIKRWGYTKEEARSLTIFDVNAKYDRKLFNRLFTKAQKSDIPLFETVHKTKEGLEYPVETKLSGFTIQGEPLMLSIARDISDRKKAEAILKESEHRFREMADHAPVLIWMSDTNGKNTFLNKRYVAYTGRSQKEQKGSGWYELVHPDDAEGMLAHYQESFKTHKQYVQYYRLRRYDGTYRWMSNTAMPRFSDDGEFLGYIGACLDIQEQREFSMELERLVAERTIELESTNNELAKMNKELQSFTYISSHDLQEPLRKIQTFSSQIMEKEYGSLSEWGKDRFKRMQHAAKRMQTLIQDLLAYSRTETSERTFVEKDLADLIKEVKEDLKEELQHKNAVIDLITTCKVNVVPFQFRQLIYNLVANSLKFAKEGRSPIIKIKGAVSKGSALKDDRLLPNVKYAHILVSDNGIGFEEKYAEQIFEVFQRLHNRQVYEGTGIGLAIVKKIVQNHRGIINAIGHLEKGATFEIIIPQKQTD